MAIPHEDRLSKFLCFSKIRHILGAHGVPTLQEILFIGWRGGDDLGAWLVYIRMIAHVSMFNRLRPLCTLLFHCFISVVFKIE